MPHLAVNLIGLPPVSHAPNSNRPIRVHYSAQSVGFTVAAPGGHRGRDQVYIRTNSFPRQSLEKIEKIHQREKKWT